MVTTARSLHTKASALPGGGAVPQCGVTVLHSSRSAQGLRSQQLEADASGWGQVLPWPKTQPPHSHLEWELLVATPQRLAQKRKTLSIPPKGADQVQGRDERGQGCRDLPVPVPPPPQDATLLPRKSARFKDTICSRHCTQRSLCRAVKRWGPGAPSVWQEFFLNAALAVPPREFPQSLKADISAQKKPPAPP